MELQWIFLCFSVSMATINLHEIHHIYLLVNRHHYIDTIPPMSNVLMTLEIHNCVAFILIMNRSRCIVINFMFID